MSTYSPALDLVWQLAAFETAQSQQEQIEPEHLFVALCAVREFTDPSFLDRRGYVGPAASALRDEVGALINLFARFALDPVKLANEVRARYKLGTIRIEDRQGSIIHRSQKSRQVFSHAEQLAQQQKASHTGVQHLLAALLALSGGGLVRLLSGQHIDIDALQNSLLGRGSPGEEAPPATLAPLGETLQEYGKNLVQLAREGNIQPAIGRKDEMLQVVRTLSRATKNNPLLIGEPGVGKTAVVEGLAWRIAQGNVPDVMRDKQIIQISVGDLIAGASYRGEFEERLQALIDEVTERPDIILFIDEIHTLVGAGKIGGGAMDAANILKPALARGELHCIGATTRAEYRQYIEQDPALERRFQPITVEEPSADQALEMLQGLQPRFERQHAVTITPDALQAAVKLSVRYLTDRRLPDKAIDLLDEACARIRITQLSVGPRSPIDPTETVTGETIAAVISEWTGIPVGQLSEDERTRLAHMADFLSERVIGQASAVESVTRALQRSRAGLKAPERPIGVLLFLGPTGVGKTELAKATAEFLFGTARALVRIDLSEYMEKHSVSRLIGAPPGYVGHDEEGQLTGALRRKPFTVVLLDEIEKAHPDVLNLFLQLFDDGRLTDTKGRTVNATNALFILTSNLGFSRPSGIGFAQQHGSISQSDLPAELKEAMRPELFNRIDDVIVFQPLKAEHMGLIARMLVQMIARRLTEQEIGLVATDAGITLLAKLGYDEHYGARSLRRAIERHVENPLGGMMLRGEVQAGQTVTIDAHRERVILKPGDGLAESNWFVSFDSGSVQ